MLASSLDGRNGKYKAEPTAKNANIISGGVLWGNGTDQELRSVNADLIFEHPNDLYTYLSDK